MKQELNLHCLDCNDSLQDCTCIEDTINMTQETLAEFTERLYQKGLQDDLGLSFHDGVKFGASWQQERMYSEEEVTQLLIKFNQEIQEVEDVREWFEQFKKK